MRGLLDNLRKKKSPVTGATGAADPGAPQAWDTTNNVAGTTRHFTSQTLGHAKAMSWTSAAAGTDARYSPSLADLARPRTLESMRRQAARLYRNARRGPLQVVPKPARPAARDAAGGHRRSQDMDRVPSRETLIDMDDDYWYEEFYTPAAAERAETTRLRVEQWLQESCAPSDEDEQPAHSCSAASRHNLDASRATDSRDSGSRTHRTQVHPRASASREITPPATHYARSGAMSKSMSSLLPIAPMTTGTVHRRYPRAT